MARTKLRDRAVWQQLEERKRQHWAEEYRRGGPRASLQAAEDLHQHMQALRPDWPTLRDRQDDLAHHVRLRALYDRAAHALIFHTRRQTTG